MLNKCLMAVIGLCLILGSGCGDTEEKPDFVFLLGAEPETFDPALCSGQPGGRVCLNLFEGLTFRHPENLTPQPGMAKSWDISEDGLVYTFHLRETTWSDGVKLTAHDFVFSWERTLRPITASKYANMLYPVAGAEEYNSGKNTDPNSLGLRAVDDLTFEVTLHSPCAYFLDLCGFYTLLPTPKHVIDEHGENWIRPEFIASNGAFTLDQWLLNRSFRFRKNPKYWNAESVALDLAEGIPAENINANFNLYMSGVFDWVDASGVPQFVIPELKKRADFHIKPYFCTYFYRFNVERPPFDDVRVRKALFLAMNRHDIVDYVTKAGQTVAHSLVPPGLPGYEEVRLPERNVEEARRLLAEAGYPEGKGFPKSELLFNTSESHKSIAEVLQQQWKEALGIEVELVNQEWKVFLATTREVDYWIARGSWIGDYLDPNTFLDMWTSTNGNNRTGFSEPEYDALIGKAARTVDVAERMRLLRQAEEWILTDQMIILPVYYYVVQNLYDERDFDGLNPNLLNTIDLKFIKPKRGHRGYPREKSLPRTEIVSEAVPISSEDGS
ncbi:MAG: peptide ABC transporter substrate-binding protein [Candidatus Eisenbacteria bacterium]|uniref:Peptide ABC transporter substrate-binding protein n=1 Tax=Eiseniibacteriota bacterium TaxID=2212470 RepID=A0A7Y2EB60_UNCEI|nr:peptide ABC transporter substrate-binding protein [Candidatus Eisenbacteria bacterium]